MTVVDRIDELAESLSKIRLAEGDLVHAIGCVGVVVSHIYGKEEEKASRFMRQLVVTVDELRRGLREAEGILSRLKDEAVFEATFSAPDH